MMKMANILISTVFLFLFCWSRPVLGARTKFLSSSEAVQINAQAPHQEVGDDQDGACKIAVEKFNYKCEEHSVTTKDGFILSIQRIPSGRPKSDNVSESAPSGAKIPVLIQHGLLVDGVSWFVLGPDHSLAFQLADAGFDVWVKNDRGTKYSRRHTSFRTDKPEYWQWTWDALVEYDFPATMEYVYNQTKQPIHYIGHSMGTLTAMAALSMNLQVNLTRSLVLLSPVAYVGQITSPIVGAFADFFAAEDLHFLGVPEFDPLKDDASKLVGQICSLPGIDCSIFLAGITGPNCCINSTSMNLFLSREPQPTSTKNLIHLSQMKRSSSIIRYDYGSKEENMKHYGHPTPPAYNMSNIPTNIPIFFAYGGADTLADLKDVEMLLENHFKNHDQDKMIRHYNHNYAHADYFLAGNAREELYDYVVDFFGRC